MAGTTGRGARAIVVKGSERTCHRPVISAEKFHDRFGCKWVVKVIETTCKLQLRNPFLKTPANCCFIAPQYRRGHARGSYVPGDSFEHLSDKTTGSPIRHRDRSARPANARKLCRHPFRTRGKHRTDQTDHNVKLAIFIRQRFRISLFKDGLQPFGGRSCPGFLEPVCSNVAGTHVRAGLCSNQGQLPGSAADIE